MRQNAYLLLLTLRRSADAHPPNPLLQSQQIVTHTFLGIFCQKAATLIWNSGPERTRPDQTKALPDMRLRWQGGGFKVRVYGMQ